jgi:hypothetical protein
MPKTFFRTCLRMLTMLTMIYLFEPGSPFSKWTTNLVRCMKALTDVGLDAVGAVRRWGGGG